MKVCILTFHKAKNYGAVLQAFALMHTLNKMGASPFLINRLPDYKNWIYLLYFRLHPKFLVKKLTWIRFDRFAQKFLIPKTRAYKKQDLHNFEQNEKPDACIAGSDQVWRMEYSDIGYNYFFDFLDGTKTRKIAYAASFGKAEWEEDQAVTEKVKVLLRDFHAVSVRESPGTDICSKIFDTQATHVLDPTLLLNREDYESILLAGSPAFKKYDLVSCFLNNTKAMEYCDHLAKQHNLSYIDLYQTTSLIKSLSPAGSGAKRWLHMSVQEWLSQIRQADYLITNSFHATVFAILFRKQFIVLDHPSGGTARITGLLRLTGLHDRFVTGTAAISIPLLQKKIDWNSVHGKLAPEKEKSLLFLKKALSTEENEYHPDL